MHRLVTQPECLSPLVDQGNILIVTEGQSPEVNIYEVHSWTKHEGVVTNRIRQCRTLHFPLVTTNELLLRAQAKVVAGRKMA